LEVRHSLALASVAGGGGDGGPLDCEILTLALVDRFAYAAVVGVGTTREEGLRRTNLAAADVRTSPVVAEPYTNPPGYNSFSANIAMLKADGRRGGFVRDRHGNPVVQTTASIEQLTENGNCFAGTPDDGLRSGQSAKRQRRRLRAFADVWPRRFPRP